MAPGGGLRLQLPDGRCHVAASAWEAVAWLNASALAPAADPWRYMVKVAGQVRRARGRPIPSADPSRFLAGLAEAGWLSLEPASHGEVDPSGATS